MQICFTASKQKLKAMNKKKKKKIVYFQQKHSIKVSMSLGILWLESLLYNQLISYYFTSIKAD